MSMFNKVTKTFQWGQHTVILETGEISRQAGGAVIVNIEDTVVLATVVAAKNPKPGQDFFPLTVDYIEKTYAAGKIPGSFFKREGRPSELETLTSRLIDRPLRPLFPEGFYNEVQVVVHVLSLNPEVSADIAALIGSSAALAISGIPFNGPIGAARVGYVNGQYVLNPGKTQLLESSMDLVVAGTEAAVLMVESEAQAAERRRSCSVASCSAISRATSRSTRSMTWCVTPASRPGTGSRAGEGRSLHRQGGRTGRQAAARRLSDPFQTSPHPGHPRRDGRDRRRRCKAMVWCSTRSTSTTCCSTSKRASCAARSWRASRASTAATRAPCARSRSATACCRAPTARRCSRAAKPRRW